MNALKAVETLRLALFQVAKTLGFVFAVLFVFSSVDFSSVDFSRADPAVEGADAFNMDVAALPLADLALLAGVPAGLFLLGFASRLWEKKLREKKQAREKERLREALNHFPPEGHSEDSSEDGSSPEGSSPEGRPPPPVDLP